MNRYFLKTAVGMTLLISILLFTRFISVDRIEEKVLQQTDKKVDPAFLGAPNEWIDSVLNSLTLEQRIAQLIMVAAYSNNTRNEAEMARLIRENKIGGLVFFQGTPYHQAFLTNYYQSLSSTPLLIAMDAENGPGMRLDSTIRYPSQIMLGAMENDRLIFEMGGQIAKQLKRLGVHVNFAPVVDVNSNPENPVINSRSFGEDLIAVSRKSLFYMIGLENAGIISVAKHFPGHGDTDTDSHTDLPVINHSKGRLDSLELFPFKQLIYNGLSGIMTAHLHVPSIDSRESVPSSLSELIIDSLLRKELGFKGLVFTDALGMKAVTNSYKPVEAAKKALLAGNDVLLMPDDIPAIIEELAKQINEGNISHDLIDNKCRKVLAAKYWAGLNDYHPIDLSNITSDLNKPEYVLLQRKLVESSLTVLQNKGRLLPLQHLDTLKVASVVIGEKRDSSFLRALQMYMPVEGFHLCGNGFDNTDSIFRELRRFNLIIASLHASKTSPANQYGISDCMLELLDSLSANNNVILDVFANPYILDRMQKTERVRSILVSYENSALTQIISAQAIFGAINLSAHIPVTVHGWSAVKSSLKLEGNGRLKFSIPAEANMSADSLDKIDVMVQKAIDFQAFPGCQILVARKGKVVFNKSYGNFTYNDDRRVTPGDLYDLASVTKVAATTQAIMHLVDDGCVDINQRLSAYLPYLEKSNKKDLLIRDILLHQSGLQSFIPFYFATRQPVFKNQPMVASSLSDAHPLKIGSNQYMNRYTVFRDNLISPTQSRQFPLQVAENMFILSTWPDSMYQGIASSNLTGKKEYLYSDLGFILFKQMVDSITHLPYDRLLDSLFYRRLGAGSLGFNPLHRFDKSIIAPTEDDLIFRRQQVQGYVHDQRAAMFGGISGHAGLFGNALDLAKLFQMLLNQGEYAGERYISKETVNMFTINRLGSKGNRRGLGFDKPESDSTKASPACLSASSSSFGHSGFTGTMVWADPAYDLIYVFLSNRVYPDASNTKIIEMNIRTDIQELVYNSMLDKSKK